MIPRRAFAGLAVGVVVAAATLTTVPAAAHHTGTQLCAAQDGTELGIWTKSDRARLGLTTRELMVDARVSKPPQTLCESVWGTSWWKRTSTNYNVMEPSWAVGNRQDSTATVDFANVSVDGQTSYINSRTNGVLVPPSFESVNLYVNTSGGVRVWFNGNLVINEWHDVSYPEMYWYATPPLSPKVEYPVVIEHYHKTGSQQLQLYWKTASTDIVKPKSLLVNDTLSTQHSSLHAQDVNGQNCTETVAYRLSSGELWIWGYDCATLANDGDDEIHKFTAPYEPEWITLYQAWNSSTTPSSWGHWYYRWDTNSWHYIGNTWSRPPDLQGWLESSGYGIGTPRGTAFNNYKEGGTLVDFTGCPETFDGDVHQAMDPFYAGTGARFYPASNAQDTC